MHSDTHLPLPRPPPDEHLSSNAGARHAVEGVGAGEVGGGAEGGGVKEAGGGGGGERWGAGVGAKGEEGASWREAEEQPPTLTERPTPPISHLRFTLTDPSHPR